MTKSSNLLYEKIYLDTNFQAKSTIESLFVLFFTYII